MKEILEKPLGENLESNLGRSLRAPKNGIFLRIYVETPDTDPEALGEFSKRISRKTVSNLSRNYVMNSE